MPALGLNDIFGSNFYSNYDVAGNWYELVFALNDFQNVEDEGEIENGLGITDLPNQANNYVNGGNAAANMLYALLLHLSQAQAENINADPEQKIFVSDGGKRFAQGARIGQIQRVITVNFFADDPTGVGLPDIDNII